MILDATATERSKLLLAQIKAIEYDLMYNKNTIMNLSDLESVTNNFLDITKPLEKHPNTNTNQNLY